MNKGDAGIVVSLIQLLRRLFPNCSLIISSQDWKRDAEFYGTNYGCEVVPALIDFPAKGHSLLLRMAFLLKELLCVVLGNKCVTSSIKNSDIVLSCGGGFLYSYNRFLPEAGFLIHCIALFFATRNNKNVILCPQSFGPFRSSFARFLARFSIKKARKIFAREPISFDILKDMELNNIALAMDLGFYLKTGKEDKCWAEAQLKDTRGMKAAVTVRKWRLDESKNPRFLNGVAAAIETLISHDFTVYIVPQVIGPITEADDRDISHELLARFIDNKGVRYQPDLEMATPTQIKAFYGMMDLVIGTRMHSTIFALSEGVPAISISYQPKTIGVFQLIGKADCVFPIENLVAGDIVNKINEVLKSDARIHIPDNDIFESELERVV